MFVRTAACVAMLLLAIVSSACSPPTAPTPSVASAATATPPPRVADPPELSCPDDVSLTATTPSGTPFTFELPSARNGENPVSVSCRPESGATFPIGSTPVQCIASDAISRSAACTFTVTVLAPRLRRTRFLAFGDSVTTGEVVIPGTDNLLLMPTPAAAYPTVLSQLLHGRYGSQSISVFNGGRSGEKAIDAWRRFTGVYGESNPEAVIVLEGYNDILYANPQQGIDAAERGVGAVAADARLRGARVFIATLAPTRPGRRQIPLGVIQAFNERLRVLARSEGAYLIDVFTPLMPDLDGNIGSDGLHPTELGYRRIAEAVFAAIRADLEIR